MIAARNIHPAMMVQIGIIIRSSADGAPGSTSALLFARAVQADPECYLSRIFFYLDAVDHGFPHAELPADETSLQKQWAELAAEHGPLPLYLCSTSAARRGLVTQQDCHPAFTLAGLAQLYDSLLYCDKVVEF